MLANATSQPGADALVLLHVEHAVAAALNDAQTVHDVFTMAANAIAPLLGWSHVVQWAPTASGTLRCTAQWLTGDTPFARANEDSELIVGEGLLGWVWESRTPIWLGDLKAEVETPRAVAGARAGFDAMVCFTVDGREGPLAIVEAFSAGSPEPSDEVLATLRSVGRRIGQFVDRRAAEAATRHSEARKRAILAAAPDCVITVDHTGRIVEANPALERIFGWAPAEVAGMALADVLVPPELREIHQAGLARVAAGAAPRMLGRLVELEAVRRDGARVPVEVTITRIDVPGPALFTGHIRDITERRAAVAELHASRQRIIEAGDEARRRVERDLHDGAQQRLVAVALGLRLAQDRLGSDPEESAELLQEARAELDAATAELRELARGIHPTVLTEQGLAAAVDGLARRAAVPLVPRVDPGRLPARVEAAAYFVIAEALTNVGRHAAATRAEVAATRIGDRLHVTVTDDGIGGASTAAGSGLRGLADRVGALGGTFAVASVPGQGSEIVAVIPCV